MRVRLWEAAMVPDDFRSTDTVRFPASLDGLRKHFLDITRVLDASDVDFRRHSIRGAEMDAADTAQTLIEVLLECDVPDAVQLNLILAQVKAATLDDEFGLGQGVLRKGQRQRKDSYYTPFLSFSKWFSTFLAFSSTFLIYSSIYAQSGWPVLSTGR